MGNLKIFMLMSLGVLFVAILSSPGQYLSGSLIFGETIENSQAKNSSDDFQTICQLSTVKGRRHYQEDRVKCNLDMHIPIHGYHGSKTVKVGLVAVFDGHIGEQASEMVSELFIPEFLVNTLKNNYPSKPDYDYFMPLGEPNPETLGSVEDGYVVMDEPNHKEILRDALLQTIKNVDHAFTQEAFKRRLASGTTAVIALLVDNQILVANIGDSKALLCSKNAQEDGSLLNLSAKELTRDHNALRDEERARIEAAGGSIDDSDWKVPLVMGHFPMTRAIGDIPLKRYGIISDPEITGWLPITANDSYLVVASDGIFESLTPKDVCNLLEGNSGKEDDIKPSAELITQTAYEEGSTDNLSVVVVPLTRFVPSE